MKKKFRQPRLPSALKKEKERRQKEQQGEGPFLKPELEANITYLREAIGHSNDVIFREFYMKLDQPVRAMLVFVDGLITKEVINEYILHALTTFEADAEDKWTREREKLAERVKDHILTINEVSLQSDFGQVITAILSGETALLIDGSDQALICNTRGWEHRGIEEPMTEAAVRGPRVGFNEILRSNTAQIRRSIRDPDLRIKTMKIGLRSQTDVAIVYLASIAKPEIVTEVEERLKKIKIDGLLESAYIQEYIEDSPGSIFPTIQVTERVDRVVAGLLEGKVAVLTDNTPFALIMPVTFWQLYYAAEDYYHRWPLAILLRLIRMIAFFFSLYLPALFIAFAVHNPELIPFNLAIKIAGTREGIPFPVFLEGLMMELAIEIIREASVRLPGPFGQTIGIVGGFVLGDAAVRAGLISPIMTIVVALTAISSFAAPSFGVAITMRLLRFPLMLVAQISGLYGLSIATIVLLIHLAGIRSFGVPYLSPLVPLNLSDLKDFLVVVPRWAMINRPLAYEPLQIDRGGIKAQTWWEALFKPPQRERKGGRRKDE